ncbi:MAG: hypothetical protein AAF517_11965 [Planctomycetota bacterium]
MAPETPSPEATGSQSDSSAAATFGAIETALTDSGPAAAFDRLITSLREGKKFPQLFEALLMKKRHELGLPLQGTESIRDLPEELQDTVESYYVETCREVGKLFLENDDIPGAWPYFRAVDETKPIAAAIDAWTPSEDEETDSEPNYDEDSIDLCDAIVNIAFNEGASPVRGYELILSQYGTCRAITIFEHQFPFSGEVQEQCGVRLVKHLYDELLSSLRYDLEGRGKELPSDATVRSLVAAHPELFDEHGYHIDVSHLQSVIRSAPCLSSPDDLDLTIQMCEYGKNLARDFQMNDPAPFDDFYNDYRIFLRALAGEGIDGAIRYFQTKADRASIDETGRHYPGEVFVHLLQRAGRYEEAIEAHLKYLTDVRGAITLAPTLPELAESGGVYDRVLERARQDEDLLQYTAALVRRSEA